MAYTLRFSKLTRLELEQKSKLIEPLYIFGINRITSLANQKCMIKPLVSQQ